MSSGSETLAVYPFVSIAAYGKSSDFPGSDDAVDKMLSAAMPQVAAILEGGTKVLGVAPELISCTWAYDPADRNIWEQAYADELTARLGKAPPGLGGAAEDQLRDAAIEALKKALIKAAIEAVTRAGVVAAGAAAASAVPIAGAVVQVVDLCMNWKTRMRTPEARAKVGIAAAAAVLAVAGVPYVGWVAAIALAVNAYQDYRQGKAKAKSQAEKADNLKDCLDSVVHPLTEEILAYAEAVVPRGATFPKTASPDFLARLLAHYRQQRIMRRRGNFPPPSWWQNLEGGPQPPDPAKVKAIIAAIDQRGADEIELVGAVNTVTGSPSAFGEKSYWQALKDLYAASGALPKGSFPRPGTYGSSYAAIRKVRIWRPQAYLSGVAVGIWKSFDRDGRKDRIQNLLQAARDFRKLATIISGLPEAAGAGPFGVEAETGSLADELVKVTGMPRDLALEIARQVVILVGTPLSPEARTEIATQIQVGLLEAVKAAKAAAGTTPPPTTPTTPTTPATPGAAASPVQAAISAAAAAAVAKVVATPAGAQAAAAQAKAKAAAPAPAAQGGAGGYVAVAAALGAAMLMFKGK